MPSHAPGEPDQLRHLASEPDFYNSALATQLTTQFGEKFTLATGPILPFDNYPGDATALQILSRGRLEALAEPVRLGGGSALVLNPAPAAGISQTSNPDSADRAGLPAAELSSCGLVLGHAGGGGERRGSER